MIMLLRFLLLNILSVYAYYNSLFHIEILVLEYSATVLSFYTTGKGLSEAFSRYGQVVEEGFHSDTLAFMSYNGNLVSKNNSLYSSQSFDGQGLC